MLKTVYGFLIRPEDEIILSTHSLKLRHYTWLDSLELNGELTPNFLLPLLTFRAGDELPLSCTVEKSVFRPINSHSVYTYFLSSQSLMKTPWDSGPAIVAWTSVRLPSSAVHASRALITFITTKVVPVALRVKAV